MLSPASMLLRTVVARSATANHRLLPSRLSKLSSVSLGIQSRSHSSVINLERNDDGVATVTINNPKKLNALGGSFWTDCKSIFEDLGSDSSIRAIVLTGEGKSFCTGIDVTDLATAKPFMENTDVSRKAFLWRQFLVPLQAAFTAIEECPKPVIASVHGHCIGAGIDMISACDIRYVAQDVKFSIKEVDVGLAADLGTLQRLPKICGNDSMIRELAYTARIFGAEEALSFGMVGKVFEDKESTFDASMKLAHTIAAKSPIAVTGTKLNLLYSRDHSVADGLDYVRTFNAAMLQSSDIHASLKAAVTKQSPSYDDIPSM